MFFFYGGLFFLLLIRMITIQATGEAEGQALAAKAAAKYEREKIINASRGKILDQHGDVIAEDTLSYRLVAVLSPKATADAKNPKHVNDVEKTASVLAEYLPLSKEEIVKRLSKEGVYQVEFGSAGRDISHEMMTKISEEKLPGIDFLKDLKRFYPGGTFASHLIGYAERKELEDGKTTTVGMMGLESIYNEQLTGKNGKVQYESDLWGYLLPNSKEMVTPAQDGYNIHTTLDRSVQNFLEDAMSRVEKEYEPEKMVAIVADPKTGKILAMSQRPTFDPETREGLNTNWLNDTIENTIEPGSTMKMFTVAAAVEEGKWSPNDYYQSGRYTLFGDSISDHNTVGWGSITYLEGFQRSSNVAMAYLLERLGDKTFIEYVKKFGFGEQTGIDLPHEASGKIIDKYPANRLTTTYGQGSTVTPMQLIQGVTAIANDGVMMRPFVIDQVVNPLTNEVVSNHKPAEAGKPISADTAKQVRELLASTVTSEKGTAKRFKLTDYTVAGKTGTAEISKPEGGYYKGYNNFLYSFLGMAPAEDPKLVVYIAVSKPKLEAGEVGSMPVSEIFKSVTENSLKYMNIKSEDMKSIPAFSIPDYEGQDVAVAQSQIIKQKMKPIIIGESGKVQEHFPTGETDILQGSLVFLKTDGPITVPDFSNWSKRNVLVYQMLSGLNIQVVGEGYVISQSVTKGTVTNDQTPIVIKLETPEETNTKVVPPPNVEGEETLPQD
ncbi:penicillin-binding transpeptidase domain-containing protein [Paenisporosarcina indica]|uniref:penicillin-binding transpeptidase domain-containing protein n=1 Tax=Paenisporosarcina indica TaxID=650093 RepID=UPI00094FAC18|nr:penicillin-binding transpeptidase domain-containing protein [Paenisporosarcina indica]